MSLINSKPKTYTENEVIKIINEFEKENQKSLKTEDIIKKKIIIADYIKWDDFRKLKQKFMTPAGFRKVLKDANLLGTKFGGTNRKK